MLLLFTGLASLGPILVAVLIVGLFLAALYYIITTFFPEPIKRFAIAIVIVLAVIILIYMLLPYAGGF